MIAQERHYCQEKAKAVDVLVEKKGGKSAVVGCNHMLFCDGTTFCRFVNPLTNRNPLSAAQEAGVKVQG